MGPPEGVGRADGPCRPQHHSLRPTQFNEALASGCWGPPLGAKPAASPAAMTAKVSYHSPGDSVRAGAEFQSGSRRHEKRRPAEMIAGAALVVPWPDTEIPAGIK